MAAWDSIPEAERPFQRRLMEVFAGFVEHVDVAGRKAHRRAGASRACATTRIILYVFGDNGASAEGQNGSISELLAQNQIPNTIAQQLAALDGLGGLDALGGPKADNMYHAGWAWAGNTPFRHTKLIASHFGGTRNPLVISWPKGIKPDKRPRPQFHHVNDIVADDLRGHRHQAAQDRRRLRAGSDRRRQHGLFASAMPPPSGKRARSISRTTAAAESIQDGWYAATFGPLTPWLTVRPGLATWDSRQDPWELYDLSRDFSQADDLAAAEPERLARMKEVFLEQARENNVFPIGAGIWLRLHPGGSAQVALPELDFRCLDDPHAGVHGTGARPGAQPRGDRCRTRRGRIGRSLCARRCGRRPDAVPGPAAISSTSTT